MRASGHWVSRESVEKGRSSDTLIVTSKLSDRSAVYKLSHNEPFEESARLARRPRALGFGVALDHRGEAEPTRIEA
jgi:hypothetical protein